MYYNMKSIIATLLIGASFLVSGCYTTPTFQKERTIPNASWDKSYTPEFVFVLPDSNSIYQPYILLRHDDSYPFMNIWLEVAMQEPGDTTFATKTKVEMQLADKQGNWLGIAQGSIWEHKIAINPVRFFKFTKPGTYKIKFTQLMRTNPLPGVLNTGFRLEQYSKG